MPKNKLGLLPMILHHSTGNNGRSLNPKPILRFMKFFRNSCRNSNIYQPALVNSVRSGFLVSALPLEFRSTLDLQRSVNLVLLSFGK